MSEEVKGVFDDLLSAPEAAIIYGTSVSTIKRKIREGVIINGVECKNYGKQWIITRDALNRVFGVPVGTLSEEDRIRLFGE